MTTELRKAPATTDRGFLLFGLQSGYNSAMENDVDLDDELRSEYDVSDLKNGVRGKYLAEYRSGTNLVLLAPDVAKAFPAEQAVNDGLSRLMQLQKATQEG